MERGLLELARDANNAALEERRQAWRRDRVSVSTFDQFNQIDDELRRARPDLARFGNQAVRSAMRRADEAMGAFFRRVADGQTPGFPRFKSPRRFRTVGLCRAGLVVATTPGRDEAVLVHPGRRGDGAVRVLRSPSCAASSTGVAKSAR